MINYDFYSIGASILIYRQSELLILSEGVGR